MKTREKILLSAARLFHENSYGKIGLYDVAKDLGLEQAHIYYHFKTKQVLALAVLKRYSETIAGRLEEFEVPDSPYRSIVNYVGSVTNNEQLYLSYGCPVTSLTSGLMNDPDAKNKEEVPNIYSMQLEWLRGHYTRMGMKTAEAKKAATELLVHMQGSIHLSHVLDRKKILRDFIREQKNRLTAFAGGT